MPDRSHLALALAGAVIGVVALAVGSWRRRAHPSLAEVPTAPLVVLGAFLVLLATGQVPAATVFPVLAVTFGARLAGAATPSARVWSADAFVAAIAATVVLYATLPDTEGPLVLGAALLPVGVAALLRPTAWRGADAVSGAASLLVGVVVVAVVAAAGRTATLAVVLAGAVVCAALAVVGERLLLGHLRDPLVTSAPARPSR